jgi:hypothetical protein
MKKLYKLKAVFMMLSVTTEDPGNGFVTEKSTLYRDRLLMGYDHDVGQNEFLFY